jgi:large subunit ribosomal protein L15
MSKKLVVRQTVSTIGRAHPQRRILKGLGLRGVGSSVVVENTPSFRGMIKKVLHLGRGQGSNVGKTCGRGQKGQKARNGGNIGKLHFEGGQTPIQRRLPKRGFRVPFPVATVAINIADLDRFDAGSEVNEATLREARLVQGRVDRIKILGEGELTKKLVVSAHKFSKGAREKIEKAGGKVVELASPSSEGRTEAPKEAKAGA